MLLALAALLGASCCASALTLTGDEVYVISPTEPGPAALAFNDVLRDAYLVLGRRPLVLPAPPAPGAHPANTTLIFFGTLDAAPWLPALFPSAPADCAGGWEAHCVLAGAVPGYASALLATGSGMRGAMYGAYSFSEHVLGTNPLMHFTDDVPAYAAPLAVADGLRLLFAPPRFKYRGLFINDEDLLAEQFPDPLGLAAMDLRAYSRIIETLLRLKGNLLVPATNPFPDQQVNALVGRRGAVLSMHHYDLVGGNVFSWPLPGTDWDWIRDPGSIAAMWRASIDAQKDIPEVIWSVGLRGLNDESYPCTLSKAACGAQISQAMGNQSAWIRAVQPNATMILYMWQELLELLTLGHLVIPEGVDVVFTDAGSGYIRVDSNWTTYCQGIYYHSAMYNGQANQLSEMVPGDRTVAQFAPVVAQSKSTTVLIDNISDLKPVPMTTQLVMQLAWDPAPFFSAPTPLAAARDYYAAWGARQHGIPGGAAAPQALAFAALWADFFAVPYVQNALSDQFLADATQGVAREAAQALAATGNVTAAALAGARRNVQLLSNGTDASGSAVLAVLDALAARAAALLPALPAPRQGFFASHTLAQLRLHAALARAMVGVLGALEACAVGDGAGCAAGAGSAAAAGDAALAALRDAEAASAPGTWRGLYAGSVLSDVQRSRDWVAALAAAARSPGGGAGVLPPVDSANRWYEWDAAWQGAPAVRAAYPLSQRYDPAVAFAVMPRINCVFAHVDAGICSPSADGGQWAAGRGGAVTLQVLASPTLRDAGEAAAARVLRYTVDGTAPSAASPAYVPGKPLVLDALAGGGKGPVTLTAAVFDAGTGAALGAPRATVWRAV